MAWLKSFFSRLRRKTKSKKAGESHSEPTATPELHEPNESSASAAQTPSNGHDEAAIPETSAEHQPTVTHVIVLKNEVDNEEGKADFGLNPLEIDRSPVTNPSGPQYAVDTSIVAIHGITGDAYDTWKTPDGTMWIKDFLLEDLPGARIFSFGYDAKVFFTRGTGDITTYARSLLENLKTYCAETPRRPLIFICHSMGGLVAKQAIVSCLTSPKNFGDITKSCRGIMFMGTPHRGATATPFPELLTRIANISTPIMSRFVGGSRTDLITSLKREALGLERLSLSFADQLETIRIASCIEQDITKPASKRIVDDFTGIIGCPGERIVHMQGCDHTTICRFSRKNNNYKIIKGILQEWANTNQVVGNPVIGNVGGAVDFEYLDPTVLRTLSFQSMDWRRYNLTEKVSPNTCTWIYDHQKFRDWVQNPKGILWIKGKPGSGKSTLMEAMVNHYEGEAAATSTVLLSFFFSAFQYVVQDDCDGNLHQSASGLYRSLAYQLMKQFPSCLRELTLECNQKLMASHNNPEHCWHENEKNLIRKRLNQGLEALIPRKVPVRIFVDAIDEAVNDTAEDILKYLTQLDKKLRSLGLDFRLCISCRHYPDITVDEAHEIIVEAENRKDIAKFIDTEFADSGIRRRNCLENEGVLSDLKTQLRERSGGMFLWVSLTIPVVIKRLNGAPNQLARVFSAIDEVQTTLGMIYSKILRDIIHLDDRLDALTLLIWALQATEPIPLRRIADEVEFSDAFYIHPSASLEEVEKELVKVEIRVGKLSGGLMEVLLDETSEKFAAFIHPSVKSFLKTGGLEILRNLTSMSPDGPTTPSTDDSGSVKGLSLKPGKESRESSSTVSGQSSVTKLSGNSGHPESKASERHSSNSGQSSSLVMRASSYTRQSLTIPASLASSSTRFGQLGDFKVQAAESWLERYTTDCRPIMDRMCLNDSFTESSRVKIAILDTGLEVDHSVPLSPKSRSRKLMFRDGLGHGAELARILLSVIAPNATVSVASLPREPTGKSIAQAIKYATEEWKADIISMSFGFTSSDVEIVEAISSAHKRGRLIFAAAPSTDASLPFRYPAASNQIISVHASDGFGNPSHSNTSQPRFEESFSFLGEGISLDWILNKPADEDLNPDTGNSVYLSGTSFATPVAAGIAASILQCCRSSDELPLFVKEWARKHTGMRTIMRYMSSGRMEHNYVTPWKLFNISDGEGKATATLSRLFEGSLDYKFRDYTIGWICALPEELAAAKAMLDVEHSHLPKLEMDETRYTLGAIGQHNIVLAVLPEYGTVQAVACVAQMAMIFPNIQVGLMVGIGAGVPPDVRLGDVVVGKPRGAHPGVVLWNMDEDHEGGRFQRKGALSNPPESVLAALDSIRASQAVGERPGFIQYLEDGLQKLPPRYKRTMSMKDILFDPEYHHVNQDDEGCDDCDPMHTVGRASREPHNHARVHYGIIASGDQVIEDAVIRDKLISDLGGNVLCIDTEAAGLRDDFPCLVIRGICDYADSHQNKRWQEHAAIVAAAFAKELLVDHMQPINVRREPPLRELIQS